MADLSSASAYEAARCRTGYCRGNSPFNWWRRYMCGKCGQYNYVGALQHVPDMAAGRVPPLQRQGDHGNADMGPSTRQVGFCRVAQSVEQVAHNDQVARSNRAAATTEE